METASTECSDPLEALLASQQCWQSEEVQNEQKAALHKLGAVIRSWEQRVAVSKDLIGESEKAGLLNSRHCARRTVPGKPVRSPGDNGLVGSSA